MSLADRIDAALLEWDVLDSQGEPLDTRSIACASKFRDLLVETLVMLDYPDDQALTPEEKSFLEDVLNL